MAIAQDLIFKMAAYSKKRLNLTTVKNNPREIMVLLKKLSKAQGFSSDELVSSEEKNGKLYVRFADYKKDPSKTTAVLNLKVIFVEVLKFLQIDHETTDNKDIYIVNLTPPK